MFSSFVQIHLLVFICWSNKVNKVVRFMTGVYSEGWGKYGGKTFIPHAVPIYCLFQYHAGIAEQGWHGPLLFAA
jgi:hypothetical protein